MNEELINLVKGLSEANLINKFYTGLKQEMKEVIKMKEPKGLRNHIAAVVKMETSLFCQMLSRQSAVKDSCHHKSGFKFSRNYQAPPVTDGNQKEMNDKGNGIETEKTTAQAYVRPRQHLTPAELAELKRLKLYFKCREKWFRGHLCGKPELQVLTLMDGWEI